LTTEAQSAKPQEAMNLKAVLAKAKANAISSGITSQNIAELDSRIKAAENFKKNMLGIEGDSADAVKRSIERLKVERIRCEMARNEDFVYPEIGLEPLRLRNKDGLPVFALHTIRSPEFRIKVRNFAVHAGSFELSRGTVDLPSVLEDCYSDLLSKVSDRIWRNFRYVCITISVAIAISASVLALAVDLHCFFMLVLIVVTWVVGFAITIGIIERDFVCRYTGLIPQPVKEKIQEAKEHFQEIYILTEVADWKLERPKRDPLVVGFAGDSLWLIADYDTTPTEEYVKMEFAV